MEVSRGYGSSPRPWGTLRNNRGCYRITRFIPTPVGNAPSSIPHRQKRPVHPHARGERQYRVKSRCPVNGSSPRPWGTRQTGDICSSNWRFIPTPVGNATQRTDPHGSAPVHPHARGERLVHSQLVTHPVGSSPRPWGTHTPHWRDPMKTRFIPTPVGNAGATISPRIPETVHPHARGERVLVAGNRRIEAGSSPRPWGTPLDVVTQALAQRFIPTPVGNAGGPVPHRAAVAVHPHARGERALV